MKIAKGMICLTVVTSNNRNSIHALLSRRLFALQRRSLVSLHGQTSVPRRRRSNSSLSAAANSANNNNTFRLAEERPPDPSSILSAQEIQEKAQILIDWLESKQQVLCLTGAGISTESSIPDYRGHQGSYHNGHKPMLYEQFMSSQYQRKRYWGRGMIGWKSFDQTQPNSGHYALANLERSGKVGVLVEDQPSFYPDENHLGDDQHEEFMLEQQIFGTGQRELAIITQNVDRLHTRAGSKHVVELHGRTDCLVCMDCGATRDRRCFHRELESLNTDWMKQQMERSSNQKALRPDGDAFIEDDFSIVNLPACQSCGSDRVKPDVVFFGDTVPKHRVALCRAAVETCDGLLVVGSSLAVHSAFRHVRHASQLGKDICVLNVGATRAEVEGVPILKLEAPAGATLEAVAKRFEISPSEKT